MPYYSGTATSFEDLRIALVNACQNHGWAWDATNQILSKGALFYKIENEVPTTTYPEGLTFLGGTGVSGGNLTGQSGVMPKMGRESTTLYAPTLPMSYSIHIYEEPDEVYFIARHSVDRFYWAAFGKSTCPGLPGTGAYVSANRLRYRANNDTTAFYSITTVFANYYQNKASAGCIFADTYDAVFNLDTSSNRFERSDVINTGLSYANSAAGWSVSGRGVGLCTGLTLASDLLDVQPSNWNNEAILIPINVYQRISALNNALVLSLKNARYVRVDYYEPEQVITLGPDKWKVYPFVQKNTQYRNGQSNTTHTGTYGWAIRYDGV